MKLVRFTCLLLLVVPVSAFQNEKPAPPKTAAKPAPANPEEAKVRTQARSLLIALSTDARSFRDQRLRGRSLARIADALWEADPTEARSMFRKAWEAAEIADQEGEARVQEDLKQQRLRTGGGAASVNTPSSIRREVLRLAARRDRVLGEEFLEKLRTQKKEEAAKTERDNSRTDEAVSQRLGLARELLQSGEVERALQIADPALTSVTMDVIGFLTELRAKNATAADSRYAALLAAAPANPLSDANTVSLLSSYIFTPGFFVIFNNGGTSTSTRSNTILPIEGAPELRAAFFQSGSAILLRPLPPPGEKDESTAGLDGRYYVIKRLMPLFEQSASAEIVAALRGQLNALTALVNEQARNRDDESLNKGIKPDVPQPDQEQSLLDRIERAKTSAERDNLYVQLARVAARKGDLSAREYVSKIEDSETRKQVQGYTDGTLASYMVQKKQVDLALELAAKGELSHLQRTWLYVECAKLVAPSDRDRAMDLLRQASDEARRIEGSDENAPRALLAVANAVKVLEPARVWDATFDAVKAANSAENFTGEDGLIMYRMQIKGSSSTSSSTVAEFDVEGLFGALATEDYDRAVELARGFQQEGPRAVATIAIARSILKPRKAK